MSYEFIVMTLVFKSWNIWYKEWSTILTFYVSNSQQIGIKILYSQRSKPLLYWHSSAINSRATQWIPGPVEWSVLLIIDLGTVSGKGGNWFWEKQPWNLVTLLSK